MKNVLVDFDSSIPNLALMQLSAYLKSKGEIVKIIPANTINTTTEYYKNYFTNNHR